ncbi:MAG: cation:dicarboxylase symporter family transporter, partial [Synergistes sp.]|nr:cation:dicarboxylase symporter family transporter [Synergistes sp.]
SMVLGIVLLLLGSRVSPVKSMLSMLNEVANFIMIYISRFLPLFIFLSVFNIFLSELGIIGNDIKGFIKMPVISILGCYLMIIFYLLAVSLRFRVSPILLSKKLIPVHLTALTTASSIAAFAVTVDTCRRFFGISKNACNFAVPLGQVIFKPGGIISVFIVVACLAEIYGIAITPLWIVNAVIIVALVAIATPPIPGAGLMAFSVIFTQLSLPPEAIAIAAVAESVLDFTLTACSVSCLQLELVFGMNGIGLLDKKILRGSVD